MAKLTPKQDLFCRQYIVDMNATQAAIRSGYSKKTAKSQGQRLLTNVDVKKRIEEYIQGRQEQVQIDANWVLVKAKELHDMAIEEQKLPVAAKALEIIGKHVDIQAFLEKSKVEHSLPGEVQDYSDLTEDDQRLIQAVRRAQQEQESERVTH